MKIQAIESNLKRFYSTPLRNTQEHTQKPQEKADNMLYNNKLAYLVMKVFK